MFIHSKKLRDIKARFWPKEEFDMLKEKGLAYGTTHRITKLFLSMRGET